MTTAGDGRDTGRVGDAAAPARAGEDAPVAGADDRRLDEPLVIDPRDPLGLGGLDPVVEGADEGARDVVAGSTVRAGASARPAGDDVDDAGTPGADGEHADDGDPIDAADLAEVRDHDVPGGGVTEDDEAVADGAPPARGDGPAATDRAVLDEQPSATAAAGSAPVPGPVPEGADTPVTPDAAVPSAPAEDAPGRTSAGDAPTVDDATAADDAGAADDATGADEATGADSAVIGAEGAVTGDGAAADEVAAPPAGGAVPGGAPADAAPTSEPAPPTAVPAAARTTAPAAPAADAHRPERSAWGRLAHAMRPRTTTGQLLTAALCALLGFALVVQVRQTTDTQLGALRQDDLVRLLDETTSRSDELAQEAADLQREHDELLSGSDRQQAALDAARRNAATQGILTGRLPATGPGVEVLLTEAEPSIRAATMLHVLEELRNAGAEAIQLNDQRVTASSAFTGSAGAVVLDGVTLAPPYRWLVIGEPDTIATALEIPGGALASVRLDGGRGTVETRDRVDVTALRRLPDPVHATPVPDEG